jgi:hypothetical protein
MLVLALQAAACSGPEKRVVDQYFNAVNANDTQTLSSFSLVPFDTKGKRIESWKIVTSSPDERSAAPLPELVKRWHDAEAEVNNNKKEANRYVLDHLNDVDQVRELAKKNAPVPAKLQPVAAEWKKFGDRARDLTKALADAKAAVDREKRNMSLSLGTAEGLEDVSGEMIVKKVEVAVDHAGETRNYDMTLRKYDVTAEKGPRPISRWLIYSLQPKA